MPVSSLYSSGGGGCTSGSEVIAELLPESGGQENRAVKLALELALLQGGSGNPAGNGHGGSSSSLTELNPCGSSSSNGNNAPVSASTSSSNSSTTSSSSNNNSNPLLQSHHHSAALNGGSPHLHGHHGGGGGGMPPPSLQQQQQQQLLVGGSLEDLKMRRSQNMTECVPVPSSEHVAEIVGRQGCKIKALRAKTNTYIKTPVRGDEPVFVVTGRKEDVSLAKREILSAAEHFSQIRASRKNQINSTLAFGQMVANSPGQTTTQVRVPYRVVGLVVGPKGATIKRIQQTTHTYIVTPSRDKEPVFEVTGLPENVDAARKEIEAHIAIRTGSSSGFLGGGSEFDLGGGESFSNGGGGGAPYHQQQPQQQQHHHQPPTGNGGGRSVSPHNSSSILNNDHFTASLTNKTLQHLLDEQHHSNGINIHSSSAGSLLNRGHPPATSVWSNGTDSHDSGIGHSPPFDSLGSSNGGLLLGGGAPSVNVPAPVDDKMAGIWGELNKVFGNLDMNGGGVGPGLDGCSKPYRSSVDLGTLGNPGSNGGGGSNLINSPSSCSSTTSSGLGASSHHRPSLDLGQPSLNSFTAMTNNTSSNSSPPNTTNNSPPAVVVGSLGGPGEQPIDHQSNNSNEDFVDDKTSVVVVPTAVYTN